MDSVPGHRGTPCLAMGLSLSAQVTPPANLSQGCLVGFEGGTQHA